MTHAQGLGQVRRSPETDTLWEAVYPGLAEARRVRSAGSQNETRPQVMRLALLYAIMDGSDFMKVEHLRAALAVWYVCDVSARRIFGGGEEQGQV